MHDPPLASRPLIGRRSVLRLLGVGALGLLAGCRSGKQQTAPTTAAQPTPRQTGSPQPSPTAAPTTAPAAAQTTALSADQLLAARVADAEVALLAAYDAAADAHPELANRLAPFRADHAAHLHGLAPGTTPTPTASLSTAPGSGAPVRSASGGPSGTVSGSAPLSSPSASTAIFRQLADLERSAAAARVNDAVTTSGSLARLVASIGGCEAAHAALLMAAT